jgi:hypothetical protein
LIQGTPERPKAEALGYLEARTRAKATARATADPYGMTNKRTSNGKNEDKSDNKDNSGTTKATAAQQEQERREGGFVWRTFGLGCFGRWRRR